MAVEKITKQITDLAIHVTSDVTQDVKDSIENGIDTYSNDVTGKTRTACFVTIYDGDMLVGGLRAESLGALFYIKHLWIEEDFRGQGLGMELMRKVEQEAVARGCHTLWVDTLSYQAPAFYKKAGYNIIATVPAYRGDDDRIFFKKDVSTG